MQGSKPFLLLHRITAQRVLRYEKRTKDLILGLKHVPYQELNFFYEFYKIIFDFTIIETLTQHILTF